MKKKTLNTLYAIFCGIASVFLHEFLSFYPRARALNCPRNARPILAGREQQFFRQFTHAYCNMTSEHVAHVTREHVAHVTHSILAVFELEKSQRPQLNSFLLSPVATRDKLVL